MVDLIWFDVLRLSRTASKDHLIAVGNFVHKNSSLLPR
jgi:hypothetical protein